MARKRKHRRPTVGVALSDTTEVWERLPWQGIEDVARERDVNLLIFVGGELRAERRSWLHANVIYDLMQPDIVDGFLIGTGAFDSHVGPEGARDFCVRRHPLPVVSVEHAIPGFPGVLLDDYQSMRQVITHLIEVHGCRRIAYIGDLSLPHVGFQARYRAYVETLQAYGLPFDPSLVCPLSMGMIYSGKGMESEWLDWFAERVSKIDALAGQEDSLVLAGLRALQALGVRVPGDVAVVGFNDDEGRYSVPPMTTLRPPYYEMGRRALEVLLAALEGQPVAEQEMLAGQLIVRQSCGCLDPAVVRAAVGPVERSEEALERAVATRRKEIVEAMVQAVEGTATGVGVELAERLLEGYVMALTKGEPEVEEGFLRELGEVLRDEMVAEGRGGWRGDGGIAAWQDAVTAMQRGVLPYVKGAVLRRYEGLGQRMRVMVAEVGRRMQGYQALQMQKRTERMRVLGAALLTKFDVGELMEILAEELPKLGIPGCYVALYEGAVPYECPGTAPEWSRMVMGYETERGKVRRLEVEKGGRRFRTQELLAAGVWPEGRRCSFMVEPLHFREQQLGFMVLEVGPRDGEVYSTLRAQVSSALYGALLLGERERVHKVLEGVYAEVERQVEERTAQLQWEIAERERVQKETLRLQEEVIAAQQRVLQELSTPIIPVLEGVIVMPLIGSIDTLRVREVMRALLAGIREHQARVVILDITGVPMVDSRVAGYLQKAVQAARLKGARTIVTGVSDAVAETIVELGIDWSGIETVSDLQSGIQAVIKAQFGSLA